VGIDHGGLLLGLTLATALVFAWTNGFNDAANAVATSVHTRALTPLRALVLAAVLNLIGALLGEGLAQTIGSALVTLPTSRLGVSAVLAGLLAAIGWNVLMSRLGVPSSSSHALIGGLTGAAFVTAATIDGPALLKLVVLPLVLSPLIALLLSIVVMRLVLRGFARATYRRAMSRFRIAQPVSASAMALGHGLQDGQKTMGIMLLALVAGGHGSVADGVPLWVKLSAATALAAGTFAGGWRIIRTLGRRIVHVDPVTGFVSESVSAGLLYTAAYVVSVPVSTTHTITAAITGSGLVAQGSRAVRWRVLRPIVAAWVVTLPATALLGAAVSGIFGLL
jgi:PiT family inorganic phosphate transporter